MTTVQKRDLPLGKEAPSNSTQERQPPPEVSTGVRPDQVALARRWLCLLGVPAMDRVKVLKYLTSGVARVLQPSECCEYLRRQGVSTYDLPAAWLLCLWLINPQRAARVVAVCVYRFVRKVGIYLDRLDTTNSILQPALLRLPVLLRDLLSSNDLLDSRLLPAYVDPRKVAPGVSTLALQAQSRMYASALHGTPIQGAPRLPAAIQRWRTDVRILAEELGAYENRWRSPSGVVTRRQVGLTPQATRDVALLIRSLICLLQALPDLRLGAAAWRVGTQALGGMGGITSLYLPSAVPSTHTGQVTTAYDALLRWRDPGEAIRRLFQSAADIVTRLCGPEVCLRYLDSMGFAEEMSAEQSRQNPALWRDGVYSESSYALYPHSVAVYSGEVYGIRTPWTSSGCGNYGLAPSEEEI